MDDGHHPVAAALSGASATIASDALMNPFDGECCDGDKLN